MTFPLWIALIVVLIGLYLQGRLLRIQGRREQQKQLKVLRQEMRHPINGITAMVGLLRESSLSQLQEEYTETIRAAVEVLELLTYDFEDLREIKRSSDISAFDLEDTLQGLVDTLGPRWQDTDRPLSLQLHPELPQKIVTDPGLLSCCAGHMLRLLGGRLEVWLAQEAERAPKLFLRAGVGVEEDRPFLEAVLKQALRALEGELRWDKEYVEVSFPVNLSLKRAKPEQQPTLLPRVLIVDDNIINRRALERQFQRLACSTETASSGEGALEKIRGSIFDLILMDCQMSGMDGLEATRRIRQLGDVRGRVPVVAITADHSAMLSTQALKIGMEEVVLKPVRLVTLRELLDRFVYDPATRRVETGVSGLAPGS